MDKSTELTAVNGMLMDIGDQQVVTLVGTIKPTAAVALSTLNEVLREVCADGWDFNEDWNVTLPLDGSNQIPLPSDAASVQFDQRTLSNNGVVERAGKAYDKTNHTFTFAQALTALRIVRLLSFEEIPETARQYVFIRASRRFQERIQVNSVRRFTQEEEAMAKVRLTNSHARNKNSTGHATDPVRGAVLGRLSIGGLNATDW